MEANISVHLKNRTTFRIYTVDNVCCIVNSFQTLHENADLLSELCMSLNCILCG